MMYVTKYMLFVHNIIHISIFFICDYIQEMYTFIYQGCIKYF